MIGPAGQHRAHHGRVGHVPRVLSRQWVVGVPAHRNHAASTVLSHGFAPDFVERHAVKVDVVPELNVAKVERHHGGIFAAHTLDVAAAFITHPTYAVHRVVMVSEHELTVTRHILKSLEHGYGLRRSRLLLCLACSGNQHTCP
ncbi:unknown [Prevotella sp. CAG:1124]|nr:unknown [Prevotella sp. CAG:1124]